MCRLHTPTYRHVQYAWGKLTQRFAHPLRLLHGGEGLIMRWPLRCGCLDPLTPYLWDMPIRIESDPALRLAGDHPALLGGERG
jgi:hypothetical protein